MKKICRITFNLFGMEVALKKKEVTMKLTVVDSLCNKCRGKFENTVNDQNNGISGRR